MKYVSRMAALAAAILTLAPATLALPAGVTPRAVDLQWRYGTEKIRGVNLGGWLVLEPWITPSLFEQTGNDAIIDEYTFGQYQDKDTALQALKSHWDSWITEDDIKEIAAAGLNHVRIPIGYWAYDVSGGEPYLQGQAEYLDKAIGWCRNAGVKVMLDLHGAPGSQNGFDNSGQAGSSEWPNDPKNVERTVAVIGQLSAKYSAREYNGVVTSLAMLNEPANFLGQHHLEVTRQYWLDAYAAARNTPGGQSTLALVISDGFQPISSLEGYMSEPDYSGVMIDTHYYQVFSDEQVAWSWDEHINQACNKAADYANPSHWLLVGEWTTADTDCAQYLNKRGVGARYDGSYPGSTHVGDCSLKTGDGSSFSPEYKDFMRKFWDIQTQTFENSASGWVYWTWKNERAADWSYSAGLAGGWIPRNPSEHKYRWNDVCQ